VNSEQSLLRFRFLGDHAIESLGIRCSERRSTAASSSTAAGRTATLWWFVLRA
jgi:hypothetical protein